MNFVYRNAGLSNQDPAYDDRFDDRQECLDAYDDMRELAAESDYEAYLDAKHNAD